MNGSGLLRHDAVNRGVFRNAAVSAGPRPAIRQCSSSQSGEAALPGSGSFPVTGVVAELTWACLGEHVPQA
ncbi:hypothetical protein [Streptomyces gardneri]|uniref:hypothetical protein n=1 Tax=Streptomyces gardneri TaxID=66892 RepID=UPI0035DA1F1A